MQLQEERLLHPSMAKKLFLTGARTIPRYLQSPKFGIRSVLSPVRNGTCARNVQRFLKSIAKAVVPRSLDQQPTSTNLRTDAGI